MEVVNYEPRKNSTNMIDGAWQKAVDLVGPYDDRISSVGLICMLFALGVLYYQKKSYWSQFNVKGPIPLPIFGNLIEHLLRPRENVELDNIRKYGKVYGYHLGTRPYLVVADANVIRQIGIKDFHIFPNHRLVPTPNKYQKHGLIFLQDDHWRSMRAIISPTFATGKIKSMVRGFYDCTHDLMDSIDEKIKKVGGPIKLNTKEVFSGFSMACTLNSFYSIKLSQSNEDAHSTDEKLTKEGFANLSTQLFKQRLHRVILAHLLPSTIQKLLALTIVGTSHMDFFYEKAKQIVEHRRKSRNTAQHNDLLKLLIEANRVSKTDPLVDQKLEGHHIIGSDQAQIGFRSARTTLTDEEVYVQALLFMNVATQTTSDLITNTTFLLAHHLDIQEKLHQELIAVGERPGDKGRRFKFTYESVASCEYLDCVISESLRQMPQIIEMDRVSNNDYYISEPYNVKVPKGTVVKMAYYSVHKDADYWPEPDKFDPERFRAINKDKIVPGSYCPFGIGPRFCIGFRFALAEAKLALACLLTEFKFAPAEGATYPAQFNKYALILSTYKDLRVNCEVRR